MAKWIKFVISIVIPFVAAAIGSAFTTPSIQSWYANLAKPSFTPPNWLFGPAWTVLYILMGIALYLFWTSANTNKKLGYKFFAAQLTLNALWSIVFFGLHQPLWGFVVIVLLWLAILANIITFYKTSRTAAYLLIPYIGWVTFASSLNFAVYLLNR